jgi:small basic protein
MSANQSSAKEGRRQRKLRHLLLDRRFQLKYTAMMVGVASLVSIVLGVFLMSTVRENSRMLQLEAEFDHVFQAQLAEADAQVLWVLVISFVAFNLVLAALAVFVTHRMAGPVFVMRRYVHELGDGKLPKVRKLRRGDEFVELVEEMSEAVIKLEARTRDELAAMERVLDGLGADPKVEALRAELKRVVEAKRVMLSEPPEKSIDLSNPG